MSYFSKKIFSFIIVVGISLVLFFSYRIYKAETKKISIEFQKDIRDYMSSFNREILLNHEVLYSLKGLIDNSNNVEPEEFSKLSKSLLLRYKNIQAVEWIPKVNHKDRKIFEDTLSKYYPSFEITQRESQGKMVRASKRENYFPVSYVEPYLGNEVALGFDLGSSSKRLKTLEASLEQGILLSTKSIVLVQDPKKQKAFLTFIPLYNKESVTVKQRKENLKGFVLGVYRIGDIAKQSISHVSTTNILFSLIDLSNKREVLYQNHKRNILKSKFIHEKKLLPFGGREWSIQAIPSATYIGQRRSYLPISIIIFGVIFVGMGAVYTAMIIHQKELVEIEVKNRTQELLIVNKKLESLSLTDSLTSIPNRRFYEEQLSLAWSRALREQKTISLLLFDIDYFKQFNDYYGHVAGDHCLQEVALCLQQSLARSTDIVARYGGEEFVMVLENTENPLVVAQRSLNNIANLRVRHEKSNISEYVSLSVGISICIPNQSDDIQSFVLKADEALYEAKDSGRNQIKVYKTT